MLRKFLEDMPFSQLIGAIGKFEIWDIVAAFQDDPVAQSCYYKIWRSVASEHFDRNDPWVMNMLRGQWELATGQILVESYPIDVVLPIADFCNARCKFCTSWLEGMSYLKPSQIERFTPLLKHAHFFGFQGHGEPLLNPRFDEVFDLIMARLDVRCLTYIITNGRLLGQKLDRLLAGGLTGYHISLNAANASTHQKVMGLGEGAFEEILDGIRRLIAAKHSARRRFDVNLSLVLTKENLAEAPSFIDLGNELGADTIFIKSLAPVGAVSVDDPYMALSPAYDSRLPDVLEKIRARIPGSNAKIVWFPEIYGNQTVWPKPSNNISVETSAVRANHLSDGILQKDTRRVRYLAQGCGEIEDDPVTDGPDPWNRQTPYRCAFPYVNFMCTNLTFQLFPCCYMTRISGAAPMVFGEDTEFFSLWNSPAYQRLRRHLRDGPLLAPCKTCPQDDI
jgi:hypothetical protein